MESKESIIIVDDDESTRKTLALIFNKKGYNVETVGTGHEALEIAQHKSFNLALLDIKLPDVDGTELLVLLKKMHPDMEMMMMTAYSSLETVIRALNEGASAYIMKPLNLEDVLNKINIIFGRQRLIAEKEKLEQDLQYQAMLVENVSDAIISTDINLNIRSWNKAAETMYGWQSDEIIGEPMSEIIPEEALYAQNEVVREHILEKGFWKGEIIQKKKDNTIINIFSSATLIKDKSRKTQGVVVINRDITERKKKEEELRLHGEIITNMSEGVYLIRADDGTIVYTNPIFEEMFGYNPGEMIGKNVSIVNAPTEKAPEEIREEIMSVLSETGEWHGEIINIKKDGTPFWCYANVSLFDHPKYGKVLISIHTDITKRKKIENQLRSSEVFLSNIFTSIQDGIIVLDKDLNIIQVNPVMERWVSHSMPILGKKCYEVYHERNEPCEICPSLQSLKTGQPAYEVVPKIGPKQNIIGWADLYSFPLLDEGSGQIIGVIEYMRDISVRKNAVEKLKNETEKVKKYLGIAGVIILALDVEGIITVLNKKGYELLQYEEGELLGKNWFESCIPVHNRKEVYGVFESLMRNELELVEFHENSILTKSGEEKIIAWNNTIIHDNNGKIIGTLSSGEDITERKKAEAELRKTMKELKSSNTELEQFAYVASHDLQEPLRMVASFTQLLQDRYKDKLDEDANDFINYAVDGATRMQNLINDLLIFSRIGSRGKPFKIIDMNVVIENVLNNFRQLIKETNSMIIYDPLPVIEADESQMIQLFQNLISNGIKFRSEKNPIIHLTAEIMVNKWIFTVTDNGIGIDNKFFDRIFIIFQRLHKKSEYGGTGIGLAVCKKIVQRHGGKIWVDSEVGKGSSFHVSIKKRKHARNSISHKKI